MSDIITIARAGEHRRATKVFTWYGAEPYRIGYKITSAERVCHNLRHLFDILTETAADPRAFVMRGVSADGIDPTRPHRRLASEALIEQGRPELGVEGPYYDDHDHHWFMVDIDGLAFTGDPTARGRFGFPAGVWRAFEELPPELRGAGFIVQWSASAILKPGIRVHLWFWGDRPVCSESLRAWAEASHVIDRAPYTAVQPHYIATPVFLEGVRDPLEGDRWQYVPGPPVKMPPQLMSLRDQARENERARAARVEAMRVDRARAKLRGGASRKSLRQYARAAIRTACENILSAPVGDRHGVIARESLSTAGLVKAGAVSESVWREEITAAAEAAVGERRARSGEVLRLLNGALERAEPTDIAHVGGRREGWNQ